MICPKCGKENKEDDLYCGACGESLIEIQTSSDVAKEVAAKVEPNDGIELVLEKNTDVEMSKIEDSLNHEEDLSNLLSPTTTSAIEVGGNAQAQTVVNQAIPGKVEQLPDLELPATKTEELIAQKQKEKAERDARLEQQRKELEKELNARKKDTATPRKVAREGDDKLFSVLAHFTPLAWLIIFLMKGTNRSEYLTDKLNDTLIIHILFLLSRLPLIGGLIGLVAIVLWFMSMYNVITDKDMKLPLISDIKLIK